MNKESAFKGLRFKDEPDRGGKCTGYDSGLSKREYFAIRIASAMVADHADGCKMENIIEWSVQLTDKLLKELEK